MSYALCQTNCSSIQKNKCNHARNFTFQQLIGLDALLRSTPSHFTLYFFLQYIVDWPAGKLFQQFVDQQLSGIIISCRNISDIFHLFLIQCSVNVDL